MAQPLWKTLLNLIPKNSNIPLTCDECFELLEYLVESSEHEKRAISNQDRAALEKIAVEHLHQCPHCQQHHLDLLKDMEIRLQNTRDD